MMVQKQGFFLTGGVFLTEDLNIRSGSIWIEGARIAEIGSNLPPPKGVPSCNIEGALVLPAFIDSHLHLEKVALDLRKVFLGSARSVEDVLQALESHSKRTPTGSWIQTFDEDHHWTYRSLKERRLPNLEEVDSVLPDHPVFISCGDRAVINTLGLKALPRDDLVHDARPALKFLSEKGSNAIDDPSTISAIKKALPAPSYEERKALVIEAMKAMNAAGISGVMDPGSGGIPYEESAQLYREIIRNGKATVRVKLMARFTRDNQMEEALSFLYESRLPRCDRWEDGQGYFGFGGIKLIVDGEIETAWPRGLSDPAPEGFCQLDEESIFRISLSAATRRSPVGIHAMGGGAMDATLKAFERVNRQVPVAPMRFSIIHAFFPDKWTFRRCRELGIIASLQQPLAYAFAPEMIDVWGEDRSHQANPIRRWIEEKIPVAAGSDVIPYKPIFSIWTMVSRMTRLGRPLGPKQAISVNEAIRSYTWGGAYLTHTERQRGSIAVGKVADLVILSKNIFEIPAEKIPDIKVQAVLVGGRPVFSDGLVLVGE